VSRDFPPIRLLPSNLLYPKFTLAFAFASTRDTRYTCHTHLLSPLLFTHMHNTSRYVVGDPPPVVSRWNALHQAAYLDRPRIAEAVLDEVNAHFERLKNANSSERSFFDDKHERCLRAFLNDPNGSMPKITSESDKPPSASTTLHTPHPPYIAHHQHYHQLYTTTATTSPTTTTTTTTYYRYHQLKPHCTHHIRHTAHTTTTTTN
jgi:hypothetical protein